MDSFEDFKLGETALQFPVETRLDNRAVVLALASQATRALYILTRDLDAPLYDSREFINAVTRLITQGKHSGVRILIQDSSQAVANGHRLVDLAYRLSSKIKIRKVCDEYRVYNEAFLVADETGFLLRKIADRYEGIVNFSDPLEARKLTRLFDEIWERSEPDPELRRLDL